MGLFSKTKHEKKRDSQVASKEDVKDEPFRALLAEFGQQSFKQRSSKLARANTKAVAALIEPEQERIEKNIEIEKATDDVATGLATSAATRKSKSKKKRRQGSGSLLGGVTLGKAKSILQSTGI